MSAAEYVQPLRETAVTLAVTLKVVRGILASVTVQLPPEPVVHFVVAPVLHVIVTIALATAASVAERTRIVTLAVQVRDWSVLERSRSDTCSVRFTWTLTVAVANPPWPSETV